MTARLGSPVRRSASMAIALALALASHTGCGPATTASPAAPTATASPAATAAKAPPKTVQLNAPGAAVDVLAALPAGYVTVVDFWSVSCEACIVQGEKLAAGVAEEPRVLIRKVDVGDGDTPVAAAYKIAVLPHFFIYDKQKRLRYDLLGPDCGEAARYARQLAAE